MIAAQLAFDRGDDTAGLDELTQALTIGEARGLMQYPGMERHVTAYLCAKALNAGIHVPFVQRMIQQHRFAAPPEAQAIVSWPWRVKVRTFGKFAVEVDGKPLEKQRKEPHRLLELLAAIVAFGGHEVPVSRLMDTLWPDVEGDTASLNLKKSIDRLRKLLAVDDLIRWEEKKISLNPDLCWVDALVFDKHSNEQAAQATALYTGPFLGAEKIYAWAEPRRDRIHAKFISFVKHRQVQQQATGTPDDADHLPEEMWKWIQWVKPALND